MSAERAGRRTAGRLSWLVLAGLVVVSLVVVVLGAALDREPVTSGQEQPRLGFGVPFAWLHQDQSSLDPPLPTQVAVASPWEHPTTVAAWPFLADVALVLACLLAVWLVVRALRGRATPSA